ncbi:hypothetical protein OV079_19715 [Nannocystis pusilla]|uniref:Uncharacterized protein n=1 Tax=Nannocystis pusilla TaxID=889268 RepID=A0A9X3IYM4_9BACT|nr:hypothetical protein [Nannocystis pusilla]MCY1007739.1 hypothetical protein [Nannocystis pusilla]
MATNKFPFSVVLLAGIGLILAIFCICYARALQRARHQQRRHPGDRRRPPRPLSAHVRRSKPAEAPPRKHDVDGPDAAEQVHAPGQRSHRRRRRRSVLAATQHRELGYQREPRDQSDSGDEILGPSVIRRRRLLWTFEDRRRPSLVLRYAGRGASSDSRHRAGAMALARPSSRTSARGRSIEDPPSIADSIAHALPGIVGRMSAGHEFAPANTRWAVWTFRALSDALTACAVS